MTSQRSLCDVSQFYHSTFLGVNVKILSAFEFGCQLEDEGNVLEVEAAVLTTESCSIVKDVLLS